jgi:repressor LexA
MQPLTHRQRGLLDFVKSYQKQHAFQPSMREIADSLGYRSVGSVWHQLHRLERLGYVRLHPNRPRAFELLTNSEEESTGPAGPNPEQPVMTPVLGHIAAGIPLLAQEDVEDVFPLPQPLIGNGEVFLLRVQGDSMVDASILDGDWIAVRHQSTAGDGQTVAALIEDEATVKVVRHHEGRVWLEPRNPNYTPILGDQASILGIVVAVLRRV